MANGFASHGEQVERVLGADGTVRELTFGGSALVPEDRVAAELAAVDATI